MTRKMKKNECLICIYVLSTRELMAGTISFFLIRDLSNMKSFVGFSCNPTFFYRCWEVLSKKCRYHVKKSRPTSGNSLHHSRKTSSKRTDSGKVWKRHSREASALMAVNFLVIRTHLLLNRLNLFQVNEINESYENSFEVFSVFLHHPTFFVHFHQPLIQYSVFLA